MCRVKVQIVGRIDVFMSMLYIYGWIRVSRTAVCGSEGCTGDS